MVPPNQAAPPAPCSMLYRRPFPRKRVVEDQHRASAPAPDFRAPLDVLALKGVYTAEGCVPIRVGALSGDGAARSFLRARGWDLELVVTE